MPTKTGRSSAESLSVCAQFKIFCFITLLLPNLQNLPSVSPFRCTVCVCMYNDDSGCCPQHISHRYRNLSESPLLLLPGAGNKPTARGKGKSTNTHTHTQRVHSALSMWYVVAFPLHRETVCEGMIRTLAFRIHSGVQSECAESR